MRRARGRQQADVQAQEIEDEPFMQRRDWERVGVGGDELNERPRFDGDMLWEEYRIKPTISLSKKVEILLVDHRMNTEEIATILNRSQEEISVEIIKVEQEWVRSGQGLDAAGRERERGRTISQLQRQVSELETEIGNNPDPRLITLKLSAIDKLTKLMGLDGPNKAAEEKADADPIAEAILNLSPQQTADLFAALKS